MSTPPPFRPPSRSRCSGSTSTAPSRPPPAAIPRTRLGYAEATVTVLETSPPVRFRSGAREALQCARERVPIGLITQGRAEMQTAKLEVLGIADAFDATVFCGSATAIPGQPDPEPFERALAALGTRPAETRADAATRIDGRTAGGARAALWQTELMVSYRCR